MLREKLIAPAIATGTAELITLPICTLRTRYINNNTIPVLQLAHRIYTTEGLRAFYKASPPAILGQIISTSSKYFLYSAYKAYLPLYDGQDKLLLMGQRVIHGVCGGLTSTIITHPLDYWKISRQNNSNIRADLKQNGLYSIYRGYTKTLLKIGVSSCLFFPLYDTLSSLGLSPLTSSATTAVVATTIMQPFDYLKVKHVSAAGFNWRNISVRRSFDGLSLNLVRVVPHFIIVMTVTDLLSQ